MQQYKTDFIWELIIPDTQTETSIQWSQTISQALMNYISQLCSDTQAIPISQLSTEEERER